MAKPTVTNDALYNAVETGIDRVRDRIIEEILMDSDLKDLDRVLDDVQTALVSSEAEKKIYRSWIFERRVPDEVIWDPEKEDEIDEEEDEE